MTKKIKLHLAAIICFVISGSACILYMSYHFMYDDMTDMQMIKKYWPLMIICVVFMFLGAEMQRKGKQQK